MYYCFLLESLTTLQQNSFLLYWQNDMRDWLTKRFSSCSPVLLHQGDEESSDSSDGTGNNSQRSWCYKLVNINVLKTKWNTLANVVCMIFVWVSLLVVRGSFVCVCIFLRIWTSGGAGSGQLVRSGGPAFKVWLTSVSSMCGCVYI